MLVRVPAGARQNIAAAFEFDQPVLGFEFGAGQEIGQVRNPQLHRRYLRQAQVLKDPEINIAIILDAARRTKAFCAASSSTAAMDAFVRFIERPNDTSGAIATRMHIANLL